MIECYVPEGRKNAISRADLRLISSMEDRTMRRQISNSEKLIINNGDGYYIPTPQDYMDVRMWTQTEWSRIRDEIRRVRKGEQWLEEMDAMCDLYCPGIEDEGLLD